MDLATDVSEKTFDRRVHVLVRVEIAVWILRDLGEPRLRLVELLGRQQPGRRKPSRVLGRRLTVIRKELGVLDAKEPPHVRVEAALDPSRPSRHTSIFARRRAACNSVSSEEMRMKPSAASCGNVSPAAYEASSVA